jgi:hypothetical protein
MQPVAQIALDRFRPVRHEAIDVRPVRFTGGEACGMEDRGVAPLALLPFVLGAALGDHVAAGFHDADGAALRIAQLESATEHFEPFAIDADADHVA